MTSPRKPKREPHDLPSPVAQNVQNSAEAWRIYEASFVKYRPLLKTSGGRRELLRKFVAAQRTLEVRLYREFRVSPRVNLWPQVDALPVERRACCLLLVGPYLAYQRVSVLLTEFARIRAPQASPWPQGEAIQAELERLQSLGALDSTKIAECSRLVDRFVSEYANRPSPAPGTVDKLMAQLPLEEAYDFIAGPWLQEWYAQLIRENHKDLRRLATFLLAGYMVTETSLHVNKRLLSALSTGDMTPFEALCESAPQAILRAYEEIRCEQGEPVNASKLIARARNVIERPDRRRRGRPRKDSAAPASPAFSPESEFALRERARREFDRLADRAGLSAREREAAGLRFVDRLPHRAIALKLGVQPTTERELVKRARRKLHALPKRIR